MSTPIIELIAANIETVINAVTVGNGFNQDLVALRSKRNDFSDVTPQDCIVLIAQQGDDRVEAEGTQTMEWNEKFMLMALVIDSDSATTSIDIRRNQVKSDIRKKLLEDPTRGGYAIETIIGGADLFDDGNGFTGVALAIEVNYRTDYDDPYAGV